jgi:predicted nucleic acid-binding protein
VAERRHAQGLLDTSVVVDLNELEADRSPIEMAVSAITIAELAPGPHATSDPDERARRQDRLQRTEATFEPFPFDADAARAYRLVHAAVVAAGRKARGARVTGDTSMRIHASGEGFETLGMPAKWRRQTSG